MTEEERIIEAARCQTGALADWQIEALIKAGDIVYHDPHPEEDCAKGLPKVMDWGITSHGIDLRLDNQFRWPKGLSELPITVHQVTPTDGISIWRDPVKLDGVRLYPGQVVLAQTKEIVSIPAWCTGYLENRSTWSRYFLFVMSTPIEAGWQGHITLEIVNAGPFTLWLPAHQGICQLQFVAGGLSRRSYKDKGGKYQDQKEPTPGFVK